MLVLALSLTAAIAFGWSSAAMHHGTGAVAVEVRGVHALLSDLFRRGVWLSGLAASLLGMLLHAVALRLGSLAQVQPVVITGLFFSLLFREVMDGRRMPRAVVGWAVLMVAGLAVFLTAAGSTSSTTGSESGAVAVFLCLGVVTTVSCWVAASRRTGPVRGVLLGLGVGVNFGLTAGVLKATAGAASPVAALQGWPLYALAVLGLSGFVANQIAYRGAPLVWTLPSLNVANPLVALAFGVVGFHERPGSGLAHYAVEVLALAAVLLGVVKLARVSVDAVAQVGPR